MGLPGGPVRILAVLGVACTVALAQDPRSLSLPEAEAIALRNHPHIASEAFTAQATAAAVKVVRSALFPTVSVSGATVGTEYNSVLSAGAVTTSSIYSRAASGLVATQLLTDFGRTSNLERSAKLRNAAQDQNVDAARAQVILNLRLAYYQALAADSILKVARETLDLRRLALRQVSALAQSALRSTLDVSFAEVNASQAELEVVDAEDAATASHTRLSAAMGYVRDQAFSLADEPLPSPLSADVETLVAESLQQRPDLRGLQLNYSSLARYAEAEKRLSNPTISAAVVAGAAPLRDERLQETYSAAGINVNVPVLNGGLFRAQREEADARAAAADKDVQDLSVQIARDVRVAWLDANDAFRRLDVTARMVAQANEALRLAQARYDSALGSIVELTQAQLNQTQAEIAAASAKYDYLERRAALDYATGSLR